MGKNIFKYIYDKYINNDKDLLNEESEKENPLIPSQLEIEKYQVSNIDMKERWSLSKEHFGDLIQYIEDDNVTDIDWDSDALWVKYANGERKCIEDTTITKDFVRKFTDRVANHENTPFNKTTRSFSSETDTLRITCVEESLATSGRSFSIRKSLPRLRFTPGQAIYEKYCNIETMSLLANCIIAHCNIVFCGKTGAGKTEAAKFFSSNFIPAEEKVITVEDTREWRYKEINPKKSGIELTVRDKEDYIEAINIALRLNPDWIMISEARSREISYVLEGMSTGFGTITTLHTDDVRKIPNRTLNMKGTSVSPQTDLNDIYSFINVGVLLKEVKIDERHYKREINQICFFLHDFETDKNKIYMVVEDGKIKKENVPDSFKKKISEAIQSDNIFENKKIKEMIKNTEDAQYEVIKDIGLEIKDIKKGKDNEREE